MEYTEAVYKHNEDESLCRILHDVLIYDDSGAAVEGVLITNIDGDRIAYKRKYFDDNFYLFDAGETPAAIIKKDEENGNT